MHVYSLKIIDHSQHEPYMVVINLRHVTVVQAVVTTNLTLTWYMYNFAY